MLSIVLIALLTSVCTVFLQTRTYRFAHRDRRPPKLVTRFRKTKKYVFYVNRDRCALRVLYDTWTHNPARTRVTVVATGGEYFVSYRFLSENWTDLVRTCCVCASLTFVWLHRSGRRKGNDTSVLFYDPTRSPACECRKWFDVQCADVDCSSVQTREVVRCLRRATRAIDVCVFALSNKPLSDEIITAHERGIPIRVIVSNCILLQSCELKRFRDIGIEVKHQKSPKDSYMHHKYAVVDSEYLINGSMNWTQQAMFDNWENVVVTNSPSLVAVYSRAFERNWATVDL